LREQFGVGFAEALGRSQFEVPIFVDDARTFMDDDFDAGFAGLFQNGLQRKLLDHLASVLPCRQRSLPQPAR